MQQDDYSVKFWACIAENHKVGLPQRCEFTFGGDCDPAATAHCQFLELVTVPIVNNMIKMLLRTCGPKLPNHLVEAREFRCSAEQNKIFEELELYMKRNKRNTESDSMKVSLPKSLYWLGTYIFFNHLLDQFWDRALQDDVWSDITLQDNISDDVFVAAVNAVMRKYMAGQAALAVDVENRSWLPRPAHIDVDDKIPEKLLRILRVSAGARITFEVMLGVIIDWRITQRQAPEGSHQFRDMLSDMRDLLGIAEKFGLGKRHEDERGYPYLHKFLFACLPPPVRDLMRKCRLPGYNWGVCVKTDVEVEAALPTAEHSDTSDTLVGPAQQTSSATPCAHVVPGGTVINAAQTFQKDAPPMPLLATVESGSASVHVHTVTTSRSDKAPLTNAAIGETQPAPRKPVAALDILEDKCRVVFNETVPNKSGLSMTSAERLQFLRNFAHERNWQGSIRETKVARHVEANYTRTTFRCHGSHEQECPLWLEMFHYLNKSDFHAPHTTIIYQHHEHNHDIDSQNAGTHLSPQQWGVLTKYLQVHAMATTKELLVHLVDQGCEYKGDRKHVTTWRKNYFSRAKKKHEMMPARFPSESPQQAPLPNRLVDLVEYQKIEQWPKMSCSEKHPSTSQLLIIPEPFPDACAKLFVSFATEGMAARIRQFAGHIVGLIVDRKQGVCSEHDFGIATLLLASKDELRNTTFGTDAAGKRVQGRAYTTHGQLMCQGVLNVESGDNFTLFFKAACWLWARCRPSQPLLEDLFIVMMKDYAPGIERARKNVFGNGHSRPLNDVFHMQRAQGALETHLRKTSLLPSPQYHGEFPKAKAKGKARAKTGISQQIKTHSSWIRSSWLANRRLPSFDLFSTLHQGVLDRIEFEFGEKAAADYLGNHPSSPYSVRLPLSCLKRDYGIICANPDEDALMTFAFHWSGLSNMRHGTDCGNTPVEAANRVHDSFEKQVRNWIMKKQEGAGGRYQRWALLRFGLRFSSALLDFRVGAIMVWLAMWFGPRYRSAPLCFRVGIIMVWPAI